MKRFVTTISFLVVLILIISSNRANFYFNTGNYYFGGGGYNLGKAEKYYNKALKLDPTLPRLNYQMSRVNFIKGNFLSALRFINKELEIYPEYVRSYYVRGLIYGYQGNYDKAIKDFEKFLEWKPDSWAGRNDLAWVYFQKGDIEAVEREARIGLTYNPENPWLSNIWGVALLNLGRNEEAKKSLELALDKFEIVGPKGWGEAYPGNDPKIYKKGYQETLRAIKANLALVE